MRRGFKPIITRPPDFDAFWRETLDELMAVEPQVERRRDPDSPRPGLVLEGVSFSSLHGARVSAVLTRWDDDRPRPLVVYSHGYGGYCVGRLDWARAGVNALGVDIRGFGRSHDALAQPSPWGWILSGVQSPESSVLRAAVCDYIRAAQVAEDELGLAVARTTFHGVSFAGAMAVMAAAAWRNPEFVAVGVPTFGWAEGRFFFVKSGSGAQINHYLAYHPERTDDVMLVLRYFDAINFAEQVRCPTLVGVGLEDEVVPAKTVYAIANHLGGPHEVMEFPVSHSDRPEQALWSRFQDYWLDLTEHGLPADFGRGGTAIPASASKRG